MDNKTLNMFNGTTSATDSGASGSGSNPGGLEDHQLEAYTVVLSVAAHLLSSLFGGGSSVAVLVAIGCRKNIDKYSYVLVLTLFCSCCALNFIWSPMEIADLIIYHYLTRHPSDAFVAGKTALFLFLVLTLAMIIALLSVEGVVRTQNSFGRILRRIWPLLSCVSALVIAGCLTAVFVTKCAHVGDNARYSYILTDPGDRDVFLGLIALAFCLALGALIMTIVLLVKENVYWEDGRPHLRQKKVKLVIPEFLISQSNAMAGGATGNGGAVNDGGYEHSGTPSPSTPKLLTVGGTDGASDRSEAGGELPELPGRLAQNKPMGNRLGINMAQVLGRRRHTICQISDSSSSAPTPADPISKAKQYNYVRKFSVDISALQAQLQNPKIFKGDAPFQSDLDISKKSSDGAKSSPTKPLLPLKPLQPFQLKFDEQEEKEDKEEMEKKETKDTELNTPVVALKVPPAPPVIMVSNDDASSTHGDGDVTNEANGIKEESFHNSKENDTKGKTEEQSIVISNSVSTPPAINKEGNGAGVQKPTTLNLTETLPEEHISVPTLESAVSDPSDTESECQKLARLSLLLCVSLAISLLPVMVTEALRPRLTLHAFLNIHTCTIAVSALQTIAYPHLIACTDQVVHRALHKLKKKLRVACWCRPESDGQNTEDESSSISQV